VALGFSSATFNPWRKCRHRGLAEPWAGRQARARCGAGPGCCGRSWVGSRQGWGTEGRLRAAWRGRGAGARSQLSGGVCSQAVSGIVLGAAAAPNCCSLRD